MQFEVTYNDAHEMVTVSTDTIDATKVPHATMRDSVQVFIQEDLCTLFSWAEDVTYSSVNTVKNGPNLVTKKQGTKYSEAIDSALFYCRRWQLSRWTLTVDSTPVPGVIFWMHELNWIFINTKWCTNKNGSVPRILYFYSSICDPVRMGGSDD